MAADGTEKVLGGTRATRYPDPFVKGTANAYGLYPWSVFNAIFCAIEGGTGTVFPLTEGLAVEAGIALLLFTSDIPAVLTVTTYSNTGSFVWPAYNVLTSYLSKKTPVVSPIGTNQVTVKYGEVAQGYVGANKDIYCAGFPAVYEVRAAGEATRGALPTINCIANSGVINGPVGPSSIIFLEGIAADMQQAPTPIMLLESDYTQAILDNGNLIKDSPNDLLYQVVGLFNVLASPASATLE
jgi:hypothetical protein